MSTMQEHGFLSGARSLLPRVFEDNWLLGKVVEFRGNSVHLDGSVFCLDSPHISTSVKSRFLTGTWEQEARYLLEKFLPRELPVIELGACIGVVACKTNRLLLNPESHIVVEPNSYLLPVLQKSKDENHCKFKIVNAAISYGADRVTFHLDKRCFAGSTIRQSSTSITVPATTLQDILKKEGFSKVSLICDIEGAERELMENEGEVLSKHVEWLIMEHHSNKAQSSVESLGFCLIEKHRHNYVYHNQGMI